MDMTSGGEASAIQLRAAIPVAGIVMLGIGCAMAWYLINELISVYQNPFENQFISKLSDVIQGSGLKFEGKTIAINQNAAKGLAVALFLMFAGLGAMLTSLFVSAGARILTSDIRRDLAWIRWKLEGGRHGEPLR